MSATPGQHRRPGVADPGLGPRQPRTVHLVDERRFMRAVSCTAPATAWQHAATLVEWMRRSWVNGRHLGDSAWHGICTCAHVIEICVLTGELRADGRVSQRY